MKKRKTSLSKADSVELIAAFWETHDLADFLPLTREETCIVELEPEKSRFPVESHDEFACSTKKRQKVGSIG